MHLRELVELAAIVSAHGPVLVRGSGELSPSGLEQYWMASKIRLDRWGHCLRAFIAKADDAPWRTSQWPHVRGAFEEVLVSEILTRVWTTVLCAHDRRHGQNVAEPIARSVMLGHTEMRHRVLTLLLHGHGVPPADAAPLDQLRRSAERWTDLLVGYLAGSDLGGEFAFDAERARDFAQDMLPPCRQSGGRQVWSLILVSLRSAFQEGLSAQSPNDDLNTRIASGVLSCFPPDVFDSTGLLRSMWMMQHSEAADDAQGMLDELLAVGDHSSKTAKNPPQRNSSLWRLPPFKRT